MALDLTGREVHAKSRLALLQFSPVQKELTAAQSQLQQYRQTLTQKYGEALKLRTFAVIAIGVERLLWAVVA